MHLSLPETIEKSIVLQDLEPSLAELDLPDLEPTSVMFIRSRKCRNHFKMGWHFKPLQKCRNHFKMG